MAQVWVEYGSECQKQFKDFQDHFQKKRVSVSGQVGRTGSFEVYVNGQMVHSTMQTRTPVDFQMVNQWIARIARSSCAGGS